MKTVRVYEKRIVPVRSWRTLWRLRMVEREVVVFAGRMTGGGFSHHINRPSVANIQAIDPLADLNSRKEITPLAD